jgi:long-chain acyl-CoA synthetase
VQVEAFLERSAARFPDKVALVCGRRRLTYAEIDAGANALAGALISSGLERFDRVAIVLENSPEMVIAVFAALKARAMFLPVNPGTKADKLVYILNNCRARALVTDAGRAAEIESRRGELPHLQTVVDHALLGAEPALAPAPAPPPGIDIDPAALIYTSGSTGRPKGVLLTHRNICAAAESITTYLENTAEDVILNVLPLSFDYGLYQVLMGFKVGARVVLERGFAYPYSLIRTMQRESVTGLPLVPTLATMLVEMDLSGVRLPALRYITNTAAALSAAHIARLRAAFPGARLYSMYGLTECKRVSYLPPEELDRRPLSVGKAIPNTEVFVVDDEGRPVGPGVVGELVVRGAHVMQGYWEDPEATAAVLKPGLFPGERLLHTGDLFYTDEEGFLFFVGRKDDIIKSRGEKVSPREVEEVLYALEGVAEAAVVGVPDERLGQAVKALLALRPGARLTEQDVLRHCSARLEDFMVPTSVEFRASLPRSANGKISKRMLAAQEAS